MRRVLEQCRKELIQFRRDKISVALAFLLPFVALLLFGFATRLEVKNLAVAVINYDSGKLSRNYMDRIFATGQLVPSKWQGFDPIEPLDKGEARACLVIPPDFSRRLKSGKSVEVQTVIDATDVNNARVIKNIIAGANVYFLRTEGLAKINSFLVPNIRLWFNPGREESLYIVPGTIALVMWIFPSLLSSIALGREKELGTMLQLYASSMTAREMLVGKMLAYTMIGLMEATLVIFACLTIFGLRFEGSPLLFLLNLLLYVTCAVNFGLLAGSVASTQNAAVQIVATFGFTSALLLSGFIYPVRNIAYPLSLISNVIPARYFIEACRDTFVRGTDWYAHLYIPLALAFFSLFLSRVAMKKNARMQLQV